MKIEWIERKMGCVGVRGYEGNKERLCVGNECQKVGARSDTGVCVRVCVCAGVSMRVSNPARTTAVDRWKGGKLRVEKR